MVIIDRELSSDTIRQMQLNELHLLREFSLYCILNELKYTIDFGSVLGAVRHKGFIPWDDDIDIAMLRDDYDRFLSLATNWNKEEIFVQNFETDKDFVHSFTRLRLNNSLALQESWENLDIHHGIFIDIFPYDMIPDDVVLRAEQELLVHQIQNRKLGIVANEPKDLSENLLGNALKINEMKSLYDLNVFQTEVMTEYNQNDNATVWVTHMTQGFESYYEFRRLMSDQMDPDFLYFEGLLQPVPKNYDAMLRNVYGDYMSFPDETERYPHHGLIDVKINHDFL